MSDQLPRTPLRFILYVLRPRAGMAMVSVFLVVLGVGVSQATPYLLKLIIDAVEAGDTTVIPWYVACYPALFFASQSLSRLTGVTMAYVSIDGRAYAYNKLTQYVLSHSHTYFSDRLSGALAGKISATVEAYESFMEYAIWNYADLLITLVTTFIFIALISPVSALVLIGICVVLIISNSFLASINQTLSAASIAAQSTQQGVLVDVVANASSVRQFSRAAFELQTIGSATTKASVAEYAARFFSEEMVLINGCIVTLGYGAVLWMLVSGYQAGEITTGNMVFVLGLMMQMVYQLLYVGNSFQRGSRHFGAIREGLSDMLLPYDVRDVPEAKMLDVHTGAITWDSVSFTYGAVQVFTDLSLAIPAGQRIGLVGPSGAGKSTFVSLLLRQHDVTSGRIVIDDQDIAAVTQNSLREAVALVPQEPVLFHRTIRENIAYGKPGVMLDEIIAVAQKARAHEFIVSLPQGYDTLVGERGVKLSGGQRQRIVIARAMLKNAPILILDEATSALDSESEIEIQKALTELMQGKTVIAIAHRLSTLREMDRIVVLDAGVVVEDGSPIDLQNQDGLYARLWSHQAGGFMPKD